MSLLHLYLDGGRKKRTGIKRTGKKLPRKKKYKRAPLFIYAHTEQKKKITGTKEM